MTLLIYQVNTFTRSSVHQSLWSSSSASFLFHHRLYHLRCISRTHISQTCQTCRRHEILGCPSSSSFHYVNIHTFHSTTHFTPFMSDNRRHQLSVDHFSFYTWLWNCTLDSITLPGVDPDSASVVLYTRSGSWNSIHTKTQTWRAYHPTVESSGQKTCGTDSDTAAELQSNGNVCFHTVSP